MDIINSEELLRLNIVKRFSYPIWVILFIISLISIYRYTIPYFINNQLPFHLNLNEEMRLAEKYFLNKEYRLCLLTYSDISEKHKKIPKELRLKVAHAAFSLANSEENLDEHFFEIGLDALGSETFYASELEDLTEILPDKFNDEYKKLFERAR